MQFQITDVEFDFEDDCDYLDFIATEDQLQEERDNVIADTLETVWEACDEDDLIEEITTATGWCIKSIDYVHVLN